MRNKIGFICDQYKYMNYSKFSNKYLPADVFRMELTADQMHYLSSILPHGYSFHIEPRRKQMKISVPAPSKKKPALKQTVNISAVEESSSQMMHSKKEKSLQHKQLTKKSQSQISTAQRAPNIPNVHLNTTTTNNKWADQFPENLRRCGKILLQLKSHKSSLPFLQPVDAIGMGIPEYLQVIKEPMDLSQVENKLKSSKYSDFTEFQSDILKIIQNSYRFNETNEEFLKVTSDFENYFNKIVADPHVPENKSKPAKKKKKISSSARESNQSVPLTLMEKKQLSQQIRRLGKEHLKGIKKIVFEKEEEQEDFFDLEALNLKKMREVQKYVRNKIIQMQDRIRASNQERNETANLDLMQSDISSFESDDQQIEIGE